jgi:DNA repair exonuclease SbcCD nuclease subunit
MHEPKSSESIKYLFLSDTHFGINFANIPRNKLKYTHGTRFFDAFTEVISNSIKREGIDFILHGGDFFNRSKPPAHVIQKATSILLKAAEDVPVYIVPGNHERSKLPIGLLKYQENINIFSEPCSYFFTKGNITLRIAGFPYIRHNAKEKLRIILKQAWDNQVDKFPSPSDYNILLLHQLIQGSKIEHYTFYKGHNVIKFRDLFSKFHLIATGHVHRFQFLYNCKNSVKSTHKKHIVLQNVNNGIWRFEEEISGNHDGPVVCYTGSLERVSALERNEEKGFILGEIAKSTSSSKPVLKSKIRFIPRPAIPIIYLKWDLNLNPEIKWLNKTINKMEDMSSSPFSEEIAGLFRISILQPNLIHPSTLSKINEFAQKNKIYLTISQPRDQFY